MITEDYVSYEVAKLLKENGFDENTNCQYPVGGIHIGEVGEYNITDRSRNPENYIPAPTLQLAMKWLREVHNLWCEISWEGKGLWCMEVFSLTDEEFIPGTIVHEIKSYEEACEEAIKCCLTNLI